MTEKLRRLSPFARFMVIYVLVMLLLGAVALMLLYGYMAAYERSRPSTCLDSYIEGVCEDGPTDALREAAASTLDYNIRSEEDSLEYIKELFESVGYSRADDRSASGAADYSLISDGAKIGTLHISQSGRSAFGLTEWVVDGEEYELSGLASQTAVTVPEGYTVSVNGKTLGDEYLADGAAEYEALSGYYEAYDNLPYMRSYVSGAYLGEAEVEVRDSLGQLVPEEEQNETYYLNNCDDSTREEVLAFTDEMLEAYLDYAANEYGAYWANLSKLLGYVKSGSRLYERVIGAQGLGFSATKSSKFVSIEPNIVCDLGDMYFVDISYVTETVGFAGPVQETSNVRLIIERTYSGLLAAAMQNY